MKNTNGEKAMEKSGNNPPAQILTGKQEHCTYLQQKLFPTHAGPNSSTGDYGLANSVQMALRSQTGVSRRSGFERDRRAQFSNCITTIWRPVQVGLWRNSACRLRIANFTIYIR